LAQPVSIVLVGIGGYGEMYLAALLDERGNGRFQLVGAVDPAASNCTRLGELCSGGVPVYSSLADFYRRQRADLALISTPIHLHCEQTCLALEHGSCVLCEKPAAATVQEVDRMIETSGRTGKWVAIGYQWSFTDPIRQLKQDIQAGMFGSARRLRVLCLWPRDESYYHRNSWAGRLRDARGEWILDSPVNNAMAHFLHNALYLLGPRTDASDEPVDVVAELYRANEIENFDTAAMRIHTEGGAEILFYGSHAVADEIGPVFSFEFTKATINCAGLNAPILARFSDGSVKRYASPESEPHSRKLWACVTAAAEDTAIPCGLKAARSHTLCINGAQDSMSRIVGFPPARIRVQGDAPTRLTWVEGLADVLRRCYADGVLPSELGLPWARPGRVVSLEGYRVSRAQAGDPRVEEIAARPHRERAPAMAHERFRIKDKAALLHKSRELAVDVPFSDDIDILFTSIDIAGRRVPNRFAVQPMEGRDAGPDGSPGELTFRRYRRFAAGGSGLIWFEATAVVPEER